jgi:hypothetical protein
MRGEFLGVWSEMWSEIWLPLIDHEGIPNDIFCELYRELASTLKSRPTVEELADIIDSPIQSREAFEKMRDIDLGSEKKLVAFLEAAHEVLDDLGGDDLSNRYFNLLVRFLEKFSLRYDLRRPCVCVRQTHVDRRWRSWLPISLQRQEWAASDAAAAPRCDWPCALAAD